MTDTDAFRVAQRARTHLRLSGARLPDVYYYGSPTLCLIDAVFSIGVKYESVVAVIKRYCEAFHIPRVRANQAEVPPVSAQEPISTLVNRINEAGPETFTTSVVRNRQRTSARGGILKAEAVAAFGAVLNAHGVEYFQDLAAFDETSGIYRALRTVRGQGSGISVGYFWMPAGSDQLVKPDRMILAFLGETLNRPVRVDEARLLIPEAAALLQPEHAMLTPRLLDFKIWEFQRAQ